MTKNIDQEEKVFSRLSLIAKRVAWLFLGLSLLLLFYVFWRSEIFYSGNLREGYKYSYLIAFSGVLFWGVVLRLKDEIQQKLIIASISALIGLYSVEIYLSIMEPHSSLETAAKKSGVFFDPRARLEVVRDLRKEGVDVAPLSCGDILRGYIFQRKEDGDFFIWFTPGGLSKKTTVSSNETGKYQIIFTDRFGFNNPDSVWNAEVADWALLGDSFTFGQSVQPGEEISSQIQSQTNSIVLNLGCPGNGPLEQLAGLKEYAEAKMPKRVLWMYYEGNDLWELKISSQDSIKDNYLDTGFSKNLMHRQEEIDAHLTEMIKRAEIDMDKKLESDFQKAKDVDRLVVFKLFHLRNAIGLNTSNFEERTRHLDVDPLFADVLKIAKDSIAGWGGELYFVYLPEFPRYKKYFVNHDAHRKRSEMLRLVESLQIPVIDIHHEVFEKHPEPLALFPFKRGGHYNAEGYKLVADTIVKEVEKMFSAK
ncbi:MAG: hypothetical protein HOJ79_06930 [Nitrospina sp.]|jgi:hypothetical protein|nr:hypothetical protein [Nitrospina sp.]